MERVFEIHIEIRPVGPGDPGKLREGP